MKKLSILFLAVSVSLFVSCAQPTSDDFISQQQEQEDVNPTVVSRESNWILAERDSNPDNGFELTDFVYYPFGYDFADYLNDSRLYSSGKVRLELVATLTLNTPATDSDVIFRNIIDNSAYDKINKYRVYVSKNVTEEEFTLTDGVAFNIYSGTDAHNNSGFYKVKKINGKWYLSQKQIVGNTVPLYR